MIDRVQQLPQPDPDVNQLLAALRRERTERVPMLELKLDEELAGALLGEPCVRWQRNAPAEQRQKFIDQTISLAYRLGYDAFRLRADTPFKLIKESTDDTAGLSRGQRQWQSEHSGPIQSFQDFERYPWPKLADVDFGPVEEIARELPEGMACLGFSGGVFEWSSWLMGLEPFAIALYDQPELVRAVVDRVGQLVYEVFEVWCRTDIVAALFIGDDLGFKTATLISPEHLREYILPWHRKYAELAHEHGKPYILHACGHLKEIMPDLTDHVGIDAKHSFEDVIEPVEEFSSQWSDKVSAIGGVDMDILGRGSEEDVAQRTRQILETCAPRGGYIAGSGNTVANYVSVGNYLAMVETLNQFNGRM